MSRLRDLSSRTTASRRIPAVQRCLPLTQKRPLILDESQQSAWPIYLGSPLGEPLAQRLEAQRYCIGVMPTLRRNRLPKKLVSSYPTSLAIASTAWSLVSSRPLGFFAPQRVNIVQCIHAGRLGEATREGALGQARHARHDGDGRRLAEIRGRPDMADSHLLHTTAAMQRPEAAWRKLFGRAAFAKTGGSRSRRFVVLAQVTSCWRDQ